MFKFIFGLIVGVLCLIFFIQNGETVSVSFLAWTLTLPRYLLMIIILFSGMFLGWILSSLRSIKKHKKK